MGRRAAVEISRPQGGLITLGQLTAAGVSTWTRQAAVRDGEWTRILPGVFNLDPVGDPDHPTLCAAAALWEPNGYVSHRSAAALWGLVEPDSSVHIASPMRSRSPVDWLVVHRTKVMDDAVTCVGSVPVASAARTLVDLSSCIGFLELQEALDAALRLRLVSLARLKWEIHISVAPRRGGARLAGLVERYEGRPTESPFEMRVLDVIRRARLPNPVKQHQVRDPATGRIVARIDLAYPEQKLAIECDGHRYHSDRSAWEKDRERRNMLTGLGWRVLQITWTYLADRPDAFIATLRGMLDD